MTHSPKFYIIRITAAIVCIQVIVFAYLAINKQAEAKRIKTQALKTLHAIQSGTVKEAFFFNHNTGYIPDELTPTEITAWEKRIDELKWLGDDAYQQLSYYPRQAGSLNVQVTPNKTITVILYDSGEKVWKEQPTPETFEGFYMAYTPDRGFMMK
jgi:hypothetical protein